MGNLDLRTQAEKDRAAKHDLIVQYYRMLSTQNKGFKPNRYINIIAQRPDINMSSLAVRNVLKAKGVI